MDEAIDIAISALRPVSRERVEKVWRGKWIHAMPILGSGDEEIRCSKCGNIIGLETDFCPYCGNPMTNEAVQMVMERLEHYMKVPECVCKTPEECIRVALAIETLAYHDKTTWIVVWQKAMRESVKKCSHF